MSDSYGKCKDCKYSDPSSKSGYKWYCEYYGTYEDPDEVRECSRFSSRGSSSGCFLTSACVEAMGLPDNCSELVTMRHFRDTWLQAQPDGKSEISEYYRIAPLIVCKINQNPASSIIYQWIYYNLVFPCVSLINEGKNDSAYDHYKKMTSELQSIFCVS